MNTLHDISNQDDSMLWELVIANDQKAFEQVVERYQGVVSAVAYSLLGNFSLCEEVTQETFWQAWRSRSQLNDYQRLAPWLCGIARNLSHQTIRNERRHPDSVSGIEPRSTDEDPALKSISAEERALVWEALESIPENYRETLVLYYREGQATSHVAKALDISLDAVKQRLSRGRDMLRTQLASKVDEILQRSRPSRTFTTRVMTGIAALAASLKVTGSAAAAGIGSSVATGTAGGLALKAAAGGAAAGVAGGLAGAAGGLGGAWLGTWLPAQLAPTNTERKLLEKNGRRMFMLSVFFTLAILALTPLLLIGISPIWYVTAVVVSTLIFVIGVVFAAVKTQRQVQKIRLAADAKDDPNPSAILQRLQNGPRGRRNFRGRRFTSNLTLLGVPLIDVQFADLTFGVPSNAATGKAFGWIAIGDRATGLLLAIGGVAKGLFAIGGLAVGLFAFGGLAIGGIALGGGALGFMAIGGGAIGYDSAGGVAVGWHSAAGGFAIANHVAIGGGAVAREFAVGGGVWAGECNSERAKAIAHSDSLQWMVEWQINNQITFIAAIIVISFAPVLALKWAYQTIDEPTS